MAAISYGNVVRKKLADISNMPTQHLIPEGKPQSAFTKDYEQLLKEKMQLMKIIADKTQVIEVTGIELQKLRINQQKMQEQNKQLAQSNSHLLAEMNACTEKLRAIQLELGCKNGLLKVLQHERESYVKVNISEEKVTLTGIEDQIEVAIRGQNADKQDNFGKRTYSKSLGPSSQLQSKKKPGNNIASVRRQSARLKSEEAESMEGFCEMPETKTAVCPPPSNSVLEDGDKQTTCKRRSHSKSLGPSPQLQSKEKAANKRACVRRPSSRFKSEESDSSEDLCEIPEIKFAVSPPPCGSVPKDGVASTVVATAKDEEKEGNAATSHDQARTSIGRPSRLAAKKVQSYKEIPLSVKMRRPD